MGQAIVKPAVIVIDLLNEYVSPDGKLYCPNASKIIGNVNRLTAYARDKSWPVIFINTALDSDEDALAERFGLHARRGSWAAQLSEIVEHRPDDLIVNKKYYDSFFETDLNDVLKKNQIVTTILCGIHTHVCVLLTAVGAFNRGYSVIVIEDAVTTDDRTNHQSRLPFFKRHIGQLLLTSEITS